MKRLPLLTALLLFAPAAPIPAAVPDLVTLQGRLTDSTGGPVAPGNKTMTFGIYDQQTGGTLYWSEVQTVATDVNGVWSAILGNITPLTETMVNNPVRWLQITVDDGINPPQALSRIRITTSPFAHRIGTVDGSTGGTISGNVAVQSDLTVAGKVESQTLKVTTGAAAGAVLTSDATGAASWQAPAGMDKPWFAGGTLLDLFNGGGRLLAYPPEQYMYGLKWVDHMIHEAVCTKWNVGMRFYNLQPHFVESDNPETGMKWGGVIFYIGTNAADDDACTSSNWRHRYWQVDVTNSTNPIQLGASNGCQPTTVYVRRR